MSHAIRGRTLLFPENGLGKVADGVVSEPFMYICVECYVLRLGEMVLFLLAALGQPENVHIPFVYEYVVIRRVEVI